MAFLVRFQLRLTAQALVQSTFVRYYASSSRTTAATATAAASAAPAGSAAAATATPVFKTTPTIAQYLKIKAEHPNYVLMFRMGDFYEMLFDDAVVASQALDIVVRESSQARIVCFCCCLLSLTHSINHS
jgi:hypothetical protein